MPHLPPEGCSGPRPLFRVKRTLLTWPLGTGTGDSASVAHGANGEGRDVGRHGAIRGPPAPPCLVAAWSQCRPAVERRESLPRAAAQAPWGQARGTQSPPQRPAPRRSRRPRRPPCVAGKPRETQQKAQGLLHPCRTPPVPGPPGTTPALSPSPPDTHTPCCLPGHPGLPAQPLLSHTLEGPPRWTCSLDRPPGQGAGVGGLPVGRAAGDGVQSSPGSSGGSGRGGSWRQGRRHFVVARKGVMTAG